MRTKSSRAWISGAIIGAVMLLAACGNGNDNGSGGGTCGKVQPCGGSIVGNWTIRSSCESVVSFTGGVDCPGAVVDDSMKVTTGAVIYSADASYTINTSRSGTIKFQVPLACTSFVTCDDYAATITPLPPTATTTCATLAADVCDCELVYSGTLSAADFGSYTTDGDTLTLTSVIGGSQIVEKYCVQGNELHLLLMDVLSGPITAGIVATR